MRVVIYNLHELCEHNTLFLSRARRYFQRNGHVVTGGHEDQGHADLVVVGGCAVTDAMRLRCAEMIQRIMAGRKHGRLVIFGCLASFPETLSAVDGSGGRVDLIPYRESARLDLLTGARIPFHEVSENYLHGHVPYQPRMGGADAYVLIAQGCVNHCSYCTIKKAKGEVVSRPEAAIEGEIGGLYRRGVRTVTLLADDCGSFGFDGGTDLPSLLGRLEGAVPDMRYKIYTMFPALFLQQARRLEPFFSARRITYLCVPAQSAAPRVLALMNRRYDPEELSETVDRLRRLDPELFVCTHFIYNFPTESWADFALSVALARHFDHSVFIGYGENSGTRAASIFPKCDDQALGDKTRHLENLVNDGRLSAFVVPRT